MKKKFNLQIIILIFCISFVISDDISNANTLIMPDLYMNRGYVFLSRGEYDKALDDFNTAIQLDPKNSEVYCRRGYYWEITHEYDKALDDFNTAIQLDPKHDYAYQERGILLGKKGEYDKAINDFNQAIQKDPKDYLNYMHRGIAWNGKGDYDKAINDFNQAIQIDPKEADYSLRGMAWIGKGDYDKAINDFNQAIQIDPKEAYYYFWRGMAWMSKAEYIKAINDYDQAIQIDPTNDYYFIWRYISSKRGHLGEGSEIENHAKNIKEKIWVTNIYDLYLGIITPEVLLEKSMSNDSKTEIIQKYEAHYYIGQYYLISGNKLLSKENFEKCIQVGEKDSAEYLSAKAELEHL